MGRRSAGPHYIIFLPCFYREPWSSSHGLWSNVRELRSHALRRKRYRPFRGVRRPPYGISRHSRDAGPLRDEPLLALFPPVGAIVAHLENVRWNSLFQASGALTRRPEKTRQTYVAICSTSARVISALGKRSRREAVSLVRIPRLFERPVRSATVERAVCILIPPANARYYFAFTNLIASRTDCPY
jgi:hypothetical protein